MNPRACAALVLALGPAAAACEAPRAPSTEPPSVVALDVALPVWELGRWTVTGFTETLRDELSAHNVRVVGHASPGQSVAVVNLGLYNNWRAIDVAVMRGGRAVFTGRVLIPDRTMPTLDKAAELVAAIVARGLAPSVDPAPGPPIEGRP